MRIKPFVAELLFPHLLLDLAVHDLHDTFCSTLSEQIRQHILAKPYPDTRVVSLLLNCLNQLRNFHLEASDTSKRKSKEESSHLLTSFQRSEREPWETVSLDPLASLLQGCKGPLKCNILQIFKGGHVFEISNLDCQVSKASFSSEIASDSLK